MIGEQLGNWSIFKELGRGGMGRVYLAQEEMAGRLAAVKVLAAELAQEEGFLRRFQLEIEALQKLNHGHIVKFYDAGFECNVHYYAMEYVEGESLERVLMKRKRLPWEEVLDMALQVCPALKHAHDHGIIHRDLKPSNLMQTAEGVIKLTDFGIAKVFAGGHLTATGNVVGTAEYISPEQAAGKPVTKRSDMYSFGIVLYVLLTGRPPFVGKGAVDLLHKHQYAQFDPPNSYAPELPVEFNELICQLMEKDPEDRPPDCLVLMRHLEKIKAKQLRRGHRTEAGHASDGTLADKPLAELDAAPLEGPATLMSRLMRKELEEQNRGGPLWRVVNHPVMLVLGLVLCVSAIVYAFWPTSAETLFQKGSQLMQSGRLSDMDSAFRDYFEPLEKRFPEHPYTEEIKAFRRHWQEARQQQENISPSIVEPLFRRGQRLQEEGKLQEARRVWQNVLVVFAGNDREKHWLERTREALTALKKQEQDRKRWQPVQKALQRAEQLYKSGKRAEAEKILRAVEQLFAGVAEARTYLEQIQKMRARYPKGY